MKKIYEQFQKAWRKINLHEAYPDQTMFEFEGSESNYNFDDETKVSICLLNKLNDSNNLILLTHLQTISKLQNDIIEYFHTHIVKYTNKDEIHQYFIVPIQSIQKKNIYLSLISILFENL